MQDTIDALHEELDYLSGISCEFASAYIKVIERKEAIKREIKEAESLSSRWG